MSESKKEEGGEEENHLESHLISFRDTRKRYGRSGQGWGRGFDLGFDPEREWCVWGRWYKSSCCPTLYSRVLV